MLIARMIAVGFAGVVAFLPTNARGETQLLSGTHGVVYEVRNESGLEPVPDYHNSNYRQQVRVLEGGRALRIEIFVDLQPVSRSAPFPLPSKQFGEEMALFLGPDRGIQVGHPDLFTLADELTKGAPSVAAAYERIADYVRDRVRYSARIEAGQDALTALRAGESSCVGFSNLTLALLRSVGVPARITHGYLPPDYRWDGVTGEATQADAGGPHAWVEFFDPARGWVFSDAILTKQFVDPHHIVRYVEGTAIPSDGRGKSLAVEDETRYRLIEEKKQVERVGESPVPASHMLGLPLVP